MRRIVRLLVAAVTVVAVVILFVLPGRTLLSQRATLARTRSQVQLLDSENAKLSATVASLRSDAEIEYLAREYYGLVEPGQHEYEVLPPTEGRSTGT
jgi:cell division protein FtsB